MALDFLDGLKGKVLDLAQIELIKHSYELQEKNLLQLERQCELLEKENKRLHNILQEKENQIKDLLKSVRKDDEFTIYEGLAFKKGDDGKFQPLAYCPNCHSVMSDPGHTLRRKFGLVCPKCKYMSGRARALPEILAKELDKKSK